jgi:hypothetical protein
MVKTSQELVEMHPGEKRFALALASAQACNFAAHGNEEARRSAQAQLPGEEERATLSEDEKMVVNRIEHRLATREIINRKEFARRYPQGWSPENTP